DTPTCQPSRSNLQARMPHNSPVNRIELTLTDIAFGGEALGRTDGRVVFVPYALPGERAEVALVQDKGDFARGALARLLEPSGDRVEPPCPKFTACGGCQWQHAGYAAQLGFKRRVVAEQLRRIGRFPDAERFVRPPIGMRSPWGYRNPAGLPVGRPVAALRFTMAQPRRVRRIDHGWLMHPAVGEALTILPGRLVGMPAHQVTIRVGANTGQRLIGPALPR